MVGSVVTEPVTFTWSYHLPPAIARDFNGELPGLKQIAVLMTLTESREAPLLLIRPAERRVPIPVRRHR